jgi:hypothetical protein
MEESQLALIIIASWITQLSTPLILLRFKENSCSPAQSSKSLMKRSLSTSTRTSSARHHPKAQDTYLLTSNSNSAFSLTPPLSFWKGARKRRLSITNAKLIWQHGETFSRVDSTNEDSTSNSSPRRK